MIVAATLSLTVSVVEKMLSQRPEWLEKVSLLETQFRAISDGDASGGDARSQLSAVPAPENAGPADRGPATELPVNLQGLVDGYSKLLEFTQHVKVRGLMLDPDFCERVEREWSVKNLAVLYGFGGEIPERTGIGSACRGGEPAVGAQQ